MAHSANDLVAPPNKVLAQAILVIGIIVGLSHVATFSGAFNHTVTIIWKFASVGTLALYAMSVARNRDGWVIALVMLLSAVSDVLIVTIGQVPGAISFIIADLIAITLYYRNLQLNLSVRHYLISVAAVSASVFLAYILPANREEALGIAIFTIPLACMTAFAFLSTFPRIVGFGAALVLFSDLLIFARLGPLAAMPMGAEAVWLLYFVGEIFVVVGVTRALRAKTQN